MAKSLVYYMSKIKEVYPEIDGLTIKAYNDISERINEDIASGVEVKNSLALKELYGKLYKILGYLGKYYSDTKLSESTFLDALSALYITLINKYITRYNSGSWYADYNNFIASSYKSARIFIKRNSAIILPSSDLTFDVTGLKEILDFDRFNKAKLREKLLAIVNTLNEPERMIVSEYYGLNGDKKLSIREIAENNNLTKTYVYNTLRKGLRSLVLPNNLIQIVDLLS